MTQTSFAPEERETVITVSDADEVVHIWTAQQKVITKLRKDPAFTELESGRHGTTNWASFTTPADRWSPSGVRRVRKMSDSQKQEGAARLLAHRENSNAAT